MSLRGGLKGRRSNLRGQKRVLMIGSSGMLGVDLCSELRRRYEVIGADIIGTRDKGQGARVKKNRFYHCDITKKKSVADVIKKARPDVVILTAAWTDVDGCERDPKRAYRVNAGGARNVALACKAAGVPLVFISTDFVFNGRKRTPYRETDKTGPVGVYGDSKLQGECAVRKALKEHIIVRTSWLYGAHGKNFVDTIIAKGRVEPVLRVVNDQVGSPTYTKDLARSIRVLLTAFFTPYAVRGTLYGTYHISNTGKTSWHGFAKAIARRARLKTRVVPIPSRELDRPAKRPAMSVMSNAKFDRAAGYRMRPWQAALAAYLIERGRP